MFQFKHGTSFTLAERSLANLFTARPDVLLASIPTTKIVTKHFGIVERELEYRFYTHSHPYVGELVQRVLEGRGPFRVPTPSFGQDLGQWRTASALYDEIFSPTSYQPNNGVTVLSSESRSKTRFRPQRSLRGLQLGTVLPRAADRRDPPQQEPALRGGDALVSLRLRSDGQHQRSDTGALLEGPAVPDDPVQMIEEILVNLAEPTNEELHRRRSTASRRGRTDPFARTLSPPTAVRLHVQDGLRLPRQP